MKYALIEDGKRRATFKSVREARQYMAYAATTDNVLFEKTDTGWRSSHPDDALELVSDD